MFKKYKRKCPKANKEYFVYRERRICNALPKQTTTTKEVTALEVKWCCMGCNGGLVDKVACHQSAHLSPIPRTYIEWGEKQYLRVSSDLHTQLWCWSTDTTQHTQQRNKYLKFKKNVIVDVLRNFFFYLIWVELFLYPHTFLTDSELIYLTLWICTSLLWKLWTHFAGVGVLGLGSHRKRVFLKGLLFLLCHISSRWTSIILSPLSPTYTSISKKP